MKSMLMAFVATAVIAFGASIVLDSIGFTAENRLSGDAVRLDAPSE